MKIPESEHSIVALIDKHHEEKNEPPRPHLGASLLGHPCDRWLWLSFRWAVQEQFPGRILRLFRRGQMEEDTIVSDLRAIGLDVRGTTGGKQTRVDFGAHVSGSLDAIIERGVPEAPKARHIAEFKTHSKKSFDEMVKDGVEKSKPQHWVQMQVYMHGTEIDRALYVAVCKDDDRIYTERVKYDKAAAEKAIERGQRIALADRMPEPMPGASASWYQCKFCAAYEFCHESKLTKHVNCRTCLHSTAERDGRWTCAHWGSDIPDVTAQLAGCDEHLLHPDLVPPDWKYEPQTEKGVIWITPHGRIAQPEFKSREVVANPQACASGDALIAEMKAKYGAEVVG